MHAIVRILPEPGDWVMCPPTTAGVLGLNPALGMDVCAHV